MTDSCKTLSPLTWRRLKHYVYAYSDPETDKVFYIGSGKGNRALHHLGESGESDKVLKINQIRAKRREPKIEIIRHGLTRNEAIIAESVAIDLFALGELTNKRLGHSAKKYGRMSLNQVRRLYEAAPIGESEIIDKVLLIRIAKEYRHGITARELYEATRRSWDVSKRRADQVEYAFSVFEGVILEVYKIAGWFTAGSIFSEKNELDDKRYEFVGGVADDLVRKKYVGRSVSDFWGKGARKPYRYVNC